MKQELVERIINLLAPDGYANRSEAEAGYPKRFLKEGAEVTRIAPSPTGFVHIGTIYAALLNQRLARQSNGIFMLRIEDTDKSRELENGQQLIIDALNSFDLVAEEGPATGGVYGPYIQSQRSPLYLGFAVDLLKCGRAYPCFASKQELEDSYKKQNELKMRPGYYSDFALWRNKSELEIESALDQKKPFVLRFKSNGNHESRISFKDEIKGPLELPQNDLDVPLIKSDSLPTYHLAHVVDDHLMGTTLVMRGDEWLNSTPLHIEISEALGLPILRYAHIAPISILDNGAKRKLSKRKDDQADIVHWQKAGYPSDSVLEYLTTLASSDFEQWRKQNPLAGLSEFPITLLRLSMSRSPLLDIKKLEDISRNVIAQMPQQHFELQLFKWAADYDQQFGLVLAEDTTYTSRVLTIERQGANSRKDLAKWSDAEQMYFYFFDKSYSKEIENAKTELLANYNPADITAACENFLQELNLLDDQPTWLDKFRKAALASGFAPTTEEYKNNTNSFKGQLADYAKIIRVLLTTKNRSPDLYAIIQIMGIERVAARLSN